MNGNYQLQVLDSDVTSFGLIRNPLYNGDRDEIKLFVMSVVSVIVSKIIRQITGKIAMGLTRDCKGVDRPRSEILNLEKWAREKLNAKNHAINI